MRGVLSDGTEMTRTRTKNHKGAEININKKMLDLDAKLDCKSKSKAWPKKYSGLSYHPW